MNNFLYWFGLASYEMANKKRKVQKIRKHEATFKKELKVIEQVIRERTPYYELQLSFPQVSYNDEEVEMKINRQIQEDIHAFASNIKDDARKFYQLTGFLGQIPLRPFEGVTTFVIHLISPTVLSMTIDYYQFKGGAHGYTKRKAYNYNLMTGDSFFLIDLFDKGYNYRRVINGAISDAINEHPEEYYQGRDSFITINPNQSFYLEPDSLVIYFDLYQIAPYVKGIPEFRIPYEMFEGHLHL
ncbi:DUF3298 and DUF4163 domain-containing protein [Vallitalea okinawensis]|uniref:DUF3298 and DUF4163 domain-containing protein n=1 Tax=Vallitalea okinawensis TaxID=2078660 RepID=UPI0014784F38|nr:DUF3298 and DUF4163 domain-containing protein [Vallitalea okinawensis]